MSVLILSAAFVVCMMCVGRMHAMRMRVYMQRGGALQITAQAMRAALHEREYMIRH